MDTNTSRPFEMGEEVKLRAKPDITGRILQINQVNSIPVVGKFLTAKDSEEIAHLDEDLETALELSLDAIREESYSFGYSDGFGDGQLAGPD